MRWSCTEAWRLSSLVNKLVPSCVGPSASCTENRHESDWKWKVNNYASKWNRSLTGVNGLNVCAPSCHKWPSRQTWLCNKRDINGDFCTSCCPRDLQGFLQVKSLHDSNKWYQVISKNKKEGFDFLINVNKHFSLYGMS